MTGPKHYTFGRIQPIDVIEDWDLPHHLACVVKYLARYRMKGGLRDVEKALWYLERFVRLARENTSSDA